MCYGPGRREPPFPAKLDDYGLDPGEFAADIRASASSMVQTFSAAMVPLCLRIYGRDREQAPNVMRGHTGS